MSSSLREWTYSDILSDEDKSWEQEHRLILKKAFQDASAAIERDDRVLAVSYLENAFSKMSEMKTRLVTIPIAFPGPAYDPWNQPFAAKELCRLYLQKGRHDSAINLASECFSGASSAFFKSSKFVSVWEPGVYENYRIFLFWGEALGNFFCQTDQEFMARQLWETILSDLNLVDWGGTLEASVLELTQQQKIWHEKISRLKPADAE